MDVCPHRPSRWGKLLILDCGRSSLTDRSQGDSQALSRTTPRCKAEQCAGAEPGSPGPNNLPTRCPSSAGAWAEQTPSFPAGASLLAPAKRFLRWLSCVRHPEHSSPLPASHCLPQSPAASLGALSLQPQLCSTVTSRAWYMARR